MFRVHCLVTQRWMKIRVPFAWFWAGDPEYGTPEVESGTIAASGDPVPPTVGPRLPRGEPPPLAGPVMSEGDLMPYQTPKHRAHKPLPETLEEKVDRLERELGQARSNTDQLMRTDRGGQ
jgi:hypothetical protein